MSKWWRKGTSVPIENPNFLQILQFYLIECPVSIPSGKDSNGRRKKGVFQNKEKHLSKKIGKEVT